MIEEINHLCTNLIKKKLKGKIFSFFNIETFLVSNISCTGSMMWFMDRVFEQTGEDLGTILTSQFHTPSHYLLIG